MSYAYRLLFWNYDRNVGIITTHLAIWNKYTIQYMHVFYLLYRVSMLCILFNCQKLGLLFFWLIGGLHKVVSLRKCLSSLVLVGAGYLEIASTFCESGWTCCQRDMSKITNCGTHKGTLRQLGEKRWILTWTSPEPGSSLGEKRPQNSNRRLVISVFSDDNKFRSLGVSQYFLVRH